MTSLTATRLNAETLEVEERWRIDREADIRFGKLVVQVVGVMVVFIALVVPVTLTVIGMFR